MEIDRRAIMAVFLRECAENLTAAEEGIRALRIDTDYSRHLERVFRAVHTLRANATSLGFADLAMHAREMERLVEDRRSGHRRVRPDFADTLFARLAHLQVVFDSLQSGGERLLLESRRTVRRTRLFVSYAHEDERWRKRVESHLAVLDREGLIDIWDDRRIGAGDAWYEKVVAALSGSCVAVLLVSSPFLTSSFIRREELPRLFDEQATNGLVLYPLLIRSCPWQAVEWLARLQLRPQDAKPVDLYRGPKIDQVLASVAEEIAGIVRSRR